MSRVDVRRIGVMILVVLFAVALLLAHAPLGLGAVRVRGVSVLWWYAAVVAPLMAVVVTSACLWKSNR